MVDECQALAASVVTRVSPALAQPFVAGARQISQPVTGRSSWAGRWFSAPRRLRIGLAGNEPPSQISRLETGHIEICSLALSVYRVVFGSNRSQVQLLY